MAGAPFFERGVFFALKKIKANTMRLSGRLKIYRKVSGSAQLSFEANITVGIEFVNIGRVPRMQDHQHVLRSRHGDIADCGQRYSYGL